jgi:organic radical activating enzyme
MQLKMARWNDEPEIFHSIQGEGRSAGRPSVFARSSLCNLHCVWCDTDYTWNWEGTSFSHVRDGEPGYVKFRKQDQILTLTARQVADRIAGFACPNVVITGGEPLLQQDAWTEVLRMLRQENADYWFEVETNGAVAPQADFDALVNQYNVSPKLSNSKNPRALREVEATLTQFANCRKATFKYVVADPSDLPEIIAQIDRFHIDSGRVYLMPEGRCSEQLRERASWLVGECLRLGFHFTDRLHIHLFQDARGH